MECSKEKWDRIMNVLPKPLVVSIPKLIKIYELNNWTDKEEYKQMKEAFPYEQFGKNTLTEGLDTKENNE